MEADRVDGLFAACADAGDDVVGVVADRAARRGGSLGKSSGDRIAMHADRFGGLFATGADASGDLVRDFRDCAARCRGSLGKSIGDRVRHGSESPRRLARRLR